MYALKQAILAKEHDDSIEVTIFHNDLRAFGKGFQRYYNRAKQMGVHFIWSKVAIQHELPENRNVVIRYRINGTEIRDEIFDLAVLSTGLVPNEDIHEIACILGVDVDKYGFIKNQGLSIIESSRQGIYLCGVCQSPKDIPDSVTMGSAAAAISGQLLSSVRYSLTTQQKEYPVERDVSCEEPRVAIFVCHCGTNIAGGIKISAVVDYLNTLSGVEHV